jgi:hypothetical protein
MKLFQAACTSILIDGLHTQNDEEHTVSGYLQIDLEGDEIVVRKPGTSFMFAYSKSAELPRLVLTRSWMKPTTPSLAASEFRTEAFQAAVSKAQELGWIR